MQRKRLIVILLTVIMILSCALTGCGGDDECSMCGGSGYYEKKDCPACP